MTIRIRRGPYPPNPIVLPEGQPCECGIISGGSTFTMLFLGSHDGQNKLLGGGFQLVSGTPAFAAPQGAVLFDPLSQTLYVSTSYPTPSWLAIGGGGGGGGGSGTIDGGTWV